ncbi:MAG: hypothetical protein ACM3X0_03635 [Bacteroidota bacterium]
MNPYPPTKNSGEPPGGHYVDNAMARRALDLAGPLIEAGLDDRQLIGSGFLHVVIMDPTQLPGQTAFEDAILHEQTFGPTTPPDADYAAFALAKARTSWRLGVDSRVVQHLSPHLLRAGDTLLAGGIWRNGIVVGVSGAFAHYDEVYATTIAAFLQALAHAGRMAEPERPILDGNLK